MIISTKLHIPHALGHVVARPELIHKLNEGLKVKLTLVSAQAGYGKTTALSEWVKQCPALIAWVSLDRQDNEWVQFWRYITASIAGEVPNFGTEIRSQLAKGASVSWQHAIAALLNELNGITDELVIILDDYHLIDLPAIHSSLAYLLEHLPRNIHLYIASRADLPLSVARLRAQGELLAIAVQDLQFQLPEALAYFRDSASLQLSRRQVTQLLNQTEGWISGLQLAAITLKRSHNIADSIRQFGGRQQHISDYLLEEVLQHQSESMRSFLMETSILNRMNHGLCEAVTGQKDSQERLQGLEQLNLFIIPLDDQRNWYRYHHLLSDFLQRMLLRSDSGKWEQVHIHAAGWLIEHGFEEEAVEHYIEGKQYADAVRLINKNIETLAHSKSVLLNSWLKALPEASFADKPMIELFYSAVLLGVGKWETAFERVQNARIHFEAMRNQWPEFKWRQAMGNVYFFHAVMAYLHKDLDKTSACFEQVEAYLPEGSFFQTMGRNRYQGYDVFDDYLSYINALHPAAELLSKWIAIWGSKQDYPFVGYLYASYSQLLYEWNRVEEAEYYANLGLERKDVRQFARILIQIALSASRIQQGLGNPLQATEILEQLKSQLDSPDNEQFILDIEAHQAGLSLRQGASDIALAWLQECGLSHTDELALNRAAQYLILARALAACERTEEALSLLRRLIRLLSKEDRLRDRIKAVILESVILHRLQHEEEAITSLELALRLGEPEGYVRSFVDEGQAMAELLSAYAEAQQENPPGTSHLVAPAYVKQLLQALNVTLEADKLLRAVLTEQEIRVLQLIGKGMSNKEISYQLHVAGETVKSHVKNIYRKLGVKNRIQALQRAKELKIPL